jgi:hypothetical protein
VDPGAPIGPQTEALERVARETPHPLVLYPEGTRTRDGEVGAWKTGALRAILGARSWDVHLLVVDGFWRSARWSEFVSNVGRIRGRTTRMGPFRSPPPGEDPEPFVSEMRARMCARLAAMRAADPDLPPSGALRATVLALASPGSLPAEARSLVDALVSVASGSVRAILLFGSRLVATTPDEHSAHDLFVVVDDLEGFYRGLKASGRLRHAPGFVAFLNRVLTPNVVSFQPAPPGGPVAKCFVLTREDLRRAVSGNAPDHFVLGRLSQRVALAWARDAGARDEMVEALATVLRRTLDWAGPFVPSPFTAESFARGMLERSYAGEIRPEARGRAGAVAGAQRDFLREAYGRVLDEAAEGGRLLREGDGYAFAIPPGPGARARLGRYFARSKARATLRWFKYVLTFDDWLDYIARKVERRTGLAISITPLERKLPLLLLWPKAIRVLRRRSAP